MPRREGAASSRTEVCLRPIRCSRDGFKRWPTMRFREPSSNLVVVGRWNQFVFSPEWIVENLQGGQGKAVLLFPVGDPTAPLRIELEHFILLPGAMRLEVLPRAQPTADSLAGACTLVSRILQLLPHTPVSGIGLNFMLEETDNPEAISTKLTLGDASRIDSVRYQWQETVIQRKFTRAENRFMNLTVQLTSRSALLDVNFHADVTNATSAIRALDEQTPESYLEEINQFVSSVYGLSIESLESGSQVEHGDSQTS